MKTEGFKTSTHVSLKKHLLDCMLLGQEIDFQHGTLDPFTKLLRVTKKEIRIRKKLKLDPSFKGVQPFSGGKKTQKKKANAFIVQ